MGTLFGSKRVTGAEFYGRPSAVHLRHADSYDHMLEGLRKASWGARRKLVRQSTCRHLLPHLVHLFHKLVELTD